MEEFYKIFNNAMELIVLGLYEKKQTNNIMPGYKYSPLLKKGIDKFSLLNLIYFENENKLPTNEFTLIETMNNPIINLVDRLPKEFEEFIKNKNDWDLNSEFISTTSNCNYYIQDDLNDLIYGSRKFKKSIKNFKNPEFELECQKFFDLIIKKSQEEYVEIRDFLEQRNHTFLTNGMLLEDENVMYFNKNYRDIVDCAYERLQYSDGGAKLCPYCNLVLKQKFNGELYCISDKCSRKTKGFSDVKYVKLAEEVLVLKDSVAYSIYYFGRLEQDIKALLDQNKLDYELWPDFDRYDFKLYISDEKWAIDAKDVKNYQYIIDDINEMSIYKNDYNRVFYVVPNEKHKHYLQSINKNISDSKYKCITLNELKNIIKEKGVKQ